MTIATAQNPGNPPEAHGKGMERHPAIHRAIRALDEAKGDLERADHDFGGHRNEALEQCEKAINQLRIALQYDKK